MARQGHERQTTGQNCGAEQTLEYRRSCGQGRKGKGTSLQASYCPQIHDDDDDDFINNDDEARL